MSEPLTPHAQVAASAASLDAPPITDSELQELLLDARTSEDARLRRLLNSYVRLRRVTADVVAFLEAREGGAAVASTPLLLRARQLAGAPRRLPR